MNVAARTNSISIDQASKPNEAIQRLLADGFTTMKDVLSRREAEALGAELSPWLARTPMCQGDFYGWRTTRVGGLLDKSPLVQRLVLNPEVLAIVDLLLKPFCDCVQLNLTQAVQVHPGERAQAPHRDEEMWPGDKHGAHWLVNVMWAVSDFTAENGATRLWPTSHTRALDRRIDPATSVAALMDPGSALIFLGSTTHGAGANLSAHARTGVIISYCLGWLKPYENQFLTYPRSVARHFPDPLQRLVGYQIHRPNLGGWEGQDPIEWLRGRGGRKPHVDALTPAIAAELLAHYAPRADRSPPKRDG